MIPSLTQLIISPHNDDETLFAAYSILADPSTHVLICLRSFVEASWPNGPTWQEREAETLAACRVLGAHTVTQLKIPDNDPDWAQLQGALFYEMFYGYDRVLAPLPEPGGHRHHNPIGEIARAVFSPKVLGYYATYTNDGKSTVGERVVPQPGWEDIKRSAYECYPSQSSRPEIHAFRWPMDEYVSAG